MKGVDASACPTETASVRIVCPVIRIFCFYSPEHVAVVYLNLSTITAGGFKGISPKPVCLCTLFGNCTTFHAFKWLHVVFRLLLWALSIFIGFIYISMCVFMHVCMYLVPSSLIHTVTKIDCCTRCQKQQLTKTAAHSLTDMRVPCF